MRCVSPIMLKSGQVVPCGRCYACQLNRRTSWAFRLAVENNDSVLSRFVTLTYDDDNLPLNDFGNPTLCFDDVRKYFHTLRSHFPKGSIRYYGCGEYGDITLRPHYHFLVFVKGFYDYSCFSYWLSKCWHNGSNVSVSTVSDARINYVTKYMMKSGLQNDDYDAMQIVKPRSFMSQGIGSSYLKYKDMFHPLHNTFVYNNSGRKIALPRYYQERFWYDKTYSDTSSRSYYYRCPLYLKYKREEKMFLNEKKYFSHFDLDPCKAYAIYIENYQALVYNLEKYNKQSLIKKLMSYGI